MTAIERLIVASQNWRTFDGLPINVPGLRRLAREIEDEALPRHVRATLRTLRRLGYAVPEDASTFTLTVINTIITDDA